MAARKEDLPIIYVIGKRRCRMIQRGEQQSIIRWIDTNADQCVPNDWLKPEKKK